MNVLQGVTLTDLKEAQRTSSLSPPDGQTEEGSTLDESARLRKDLTDDRGVKKTECIETIEVNPKWSKIDKVSERNSLPAAETVCDFIGSYIFFYSQSCAGGEP